MEYLKFSPNILRYLTDYTKINCILTTRRGYSLQLTAHYSNGSQLAITPQQHITTFPNDPLPILGGYLEDNYLDNFILINKNRIAINRENFEQFSFTPSKDAKFTDINANFKNGKCIRLYGIKTKFLQKEQHFLDNLSINKTESMEM